MTVYEKIKTMSYEKIKTMSKEELVEFLMGFDNHEDTIGYIYCTSVCKDRTEDMGCICPDNEEPPCMKMGVKEMTLALMDQAFDERQKE